MTELQKSLELLAKSIDTHYDLARMALFGPLEKECHLERFTTSAAWGPRDFEGGTHRCERPSYATIPTRPAGAWTDLAQRTTHILDAARNIQAFASSNVEFFDHVAYCGCGYNAKPLSQLTLKVSFTWHGRTLTREYLLPEGKP